MPRLLYVMTWRHSIYLVAFSICVVYNDDNCLPQWSSKMRKDTTFEMLLNVPMCTYMDKASHLVTTFLVASPVSGHPSAADEAWYWLKHVLRSGWLCRTSRPGNMWFTSRSCMLWFPVTVNFTLLPICLLLPNGTWIISCIPPQRSINYFLSTKALMPYSVDQIFWHETISTGANNICFKSWKPHDVPVLRSLMNILSHFKAEM